MSGGFGSHRRPGSQMVLSRLRKLATRVVREDQLPELARWIWIAAIEVAPG